MSTFRSRPGRPVQRWDIEFFVSRPGRIWIERRRRQDPGSLSVSNVNGVEPELDFSTTPVALKKVVVIDARGTERKLTFSNVKRNVYIKPRMFVIGDPTKPIGVDRG